MSMEKRASPATELYRVRAESMLFNDRVYERGELVSGGVVGKHVRTLVENGHLESVADEAVEGTFRERLVFSVSRLLGMSRVR